MKKHELAEKFNGFPGIEELLKRIDDSTDIRDVKADNETILCLIGYEFDHKYLNNERRQEKGCRVYGLSRGVLIEYSWPYRKYYEHDGKIWDYCWHKEWEAQKLTEIGQVKEKTETGEGVCGIYMLRQAYKYELRKIAVHFKTDAVEGWALGEKRKEILQNPTK